MVHTDHETVVQAAVGHEECGELGEVRVAQALRAALAWVLTELGSAERRCLPASASVEQFPLMLRLTSASFDFDQARPSGEDLRFASAAGKPLAYQIETWDAKRGEATIWVRIPRITGNAHQRIQLHWGNPDAASESNGAAVFNATNGYLSVWHMDESNADAVGTLTATDAKWEMKVIQPLAFTE